MMKKGEGKRKKTLPKGDKKRQYPSKKKKNHLGEGKERGKSYPPLIKPRGRKKRKSRTLFPGKEKEKNRAKKKKRLISTS